ncbi:MAG: cyclase family protein [Acidimicrobiia bacterium]|nr:cyclase family protein [Acidimicrobiia bacterium]
MGAVPGEPSNWGRWGDGDQLGTTNLLTAERVAAAARLVRTGRRFPLGLPIGGPPTPGYRPAPLHLQAVTAGDSVLGDGGRDGFCASDDYVVMALQASTQLDGFGHVGAGATLYNGFWSGLVTTRSGARRLGIHHLAAGIVGRGVLLDVARHAGLDELAPGTALGAEELAATADAQGVEVGPGDALLVRTGWLGRRLVEGRPVGPGGGEPGLSDRAVPWLAGRDVVLVATDTMTCEVVPPEPGTPMLTFHARALRDLGMLLGELFDLDELAADCAADGVYEFFFAAMPMPVVGGVGSPVNPLAVK